MIMKKILVALAVLASMQTVDAQVKAVVDARKAVESAEQAAQNPKKAAKSATWMKLAQAYVNAYDAPTANVLGGNKQELALVMGNETPSSVEEVVIGGVTLEKNVYNGKNLYFDASGALIATEVTEPALEGDPLAKAVEAYAKAFELGAKAADVETGLNTVSEKYFQEAYNKYSLGDPAEASRLFGLAADAASLTPSHRVDTTSIYYAGITALEGSEFESAREYFTRAHDYGYYGENGAVYANLGSAALGMQDTVAAQNYLEDGFSKYPESGQIMTNLINLYLATKENPEKLISLLDEAKKQMPDNASLYFVEGNILAQVKEYDRALEAYRKAGEIDPDYEMGYYGEGTLHYTRALEIQEEAEALPVQEYQKYDELQEQLAATLKQAIGPFEKVFGMTKSDEVKQVAADYLKRLYFLFRDEKPENQEAYEKYDAFLKGE